MKTVQFSLDFTDVFGVHHPAAICYISNLAHSISVNFQTGDELINHGSQVSYSVRFWHDEAAKAAGAKTQEISSKVGQTTFYLNDVSLDTTVEELVALAAEHFQAQVVVELDKVPSL